MQHAAATPPEWLASWAPQWVLDVAAVPPMVEMLPGWLTGFLVLVHLFHVRGYLIMGAVMIWHGRQPDVLLPEFQTRFGVFVFLCGKTHAADVVAMLLVGGWTWFIAIPVYLASAVSTELTLQDGRRHWEQIRPQLTARD